MTFIPENSPQSVDNGSKLPGATSATAIKVGSVMEEYQWVARHLPNYKLVEQSMTRIDGTPYDLLNLRNGQGDERSCYFDISSFFGR